MSNNYYTEVVVSYKKTLNSMDKFSTHLDTQYAQLKKLDTAYKENGMEDMLKKYDKLLRKLAKVTALERDYQNTLSKTDNITKKNVQNIEKLKTKYIEGYSALSKYNEGLKSVTFMLDKAKISDVEATAAKKSLTTEYKLSALAISSVEKSLNTLKAKHIEGAAAVQLLIQKEKELKILVDIGAMSKAEAATKMKKYKLEAADTATKIGKLAAAERDANRTRASASAEMTKLLNKYDQSTEATKRRSRAIKELNILQKKGIISDQRAIELLRRFSIANSEATQSVKKLSAAMHAWQSVVKTLHVLWKVFFAVMAAQTLTKWITDFAKAGENIELLGRKLEIFTGDAMALKKVSEVAIRVGIDFDTLNKTMTRFALTTKGAFSVEEMLDWTEALVKAGRITGTTTQELKSGLLQLSQAMSAGRLMGDEYRSISENMPMLKQAIEGVFEEMGRGNEDLKTLSRNGEITSEILVKSFGKLGMTVAGMGDVWDTIDAALERVVIQWQLFVYQMSKDNSVFKNIVNGIADIIGTIREGLFGELFDDSGKAIKNISQLNNHIKESGKNLKEIAGVLGKTTKGIEDFSSAILGSVTATAGVSEEIKETSIALTLLGTAMSIIVPLFSLGLIANIGKFVFNLSGIAKLASSSGTAIKFLSAGVNGLKGAFLLAAVGANKFFETIKYGATLLKGLALPVTYAAMLAYPILAILDHIEKLDRLKVVHKEVSTGTESLSERLERLKEAFSELSVSSTQVEMQRLANQLIENSTNSDQLRDRIEFLRKEIERNPEEVIRLRDEMLILLDAMQKLEDKSKTLAVQIQLGGERISNSITSFAEARKKAQDLVDLTFDTESFEDFEKYNKEQADLRDKFDSLKLSIKGATEQQIEFIEASERAAMKNLSMKYFAEDVKEATKEFNKLLEAEKNLAKVRDANIGGKQLEDAIKQVEKYNGVEKARKLALEATKAAKEQLSKELVLGTKLLDIELIGLEKLNPLLVKYIKETNELTNELKLKKINQEEYNKYLIAEQKILKLSQDAKRAEDLQKLTLKYNEVAKATYDYAEAERELITLQNAGKISSKEANNILYDQELVMLKLKATMGDMSHEEQYFEGMRAGFHAIENDSTSILEDMETATIKAFNGMTDAIVEFAMTGKLSFTDMANSMVEDMIRIMVQQSITTPLASMATSFIGSMFTGGASSAVTGNYMASTLGGSAMPSAASVFDIFAKGDTMSGDGISAYSNQIVSQPTVFPFASGVGLMGEAGDEAIMPLTRTSSGNLGVETTSKQKKDPVVNIHFNDYAGVEKSSTQKIDNNGNIDIDVMIEKKVNAALKNGSLDRSMSSNYGNKRIGY